MRIEEKRATLAIHTLLEKYVDWTATESRCGICENYDRIWSCPTYDFSVEAYWRQFFSVQLLATKIYLDADELADVDKVLDQVHRDIRDYWRKNETLHIDSQYLAPGSCHLCPEGCTRKVGAPCRRPDQLRYSIESLGGDVVALSEDVLGTKILWGSPEKPPEYYTLVSGLPLKR